MARPIPSLFVELKGREKKRKEDKISQEGERLFRVHSPHDAFSPIPLLGSTRKGRKKKGKGRKGGSYWFTFFFTRPHPIVPV